MDTTDTPINGNTTAPTPTRQLELHTVRLDSKGDSLHLDFFYTLPRSMMFVMALGQLEQQQVSLVQALADGKAKAAPMGRWVPVLIYADDESDPTPVKRHVFLVPMGQKVAVSEKTSYMGTVFTPKGLPIAIYEDIS